MNSTLTKNKKLIFFTRFGLILGLVLSLALGMCSAFLVQAKVEEYTATVYHRHGEDCWQDVVCGGTMKEVEYFTQGCDCGPDHPCTNHGCYWEDPNSTYPFGCWHCYCPKGKAFFCSICKTKGIAGTCPIVENKLVCEKEGVEAAHITVIKSTEGWTNSLQLAAKIQLLNGTSLEAPYIWNGQEPSSNAVFDVTGNGVYTFSMADDGYSNASEVIISIPVEHFDNTPPTVKLSYDETPDLAGTTVKVEASDIQTDGAEGCGLAEEPYSFDGGQTWQSIGEKEIDQNGTVTVLVRDKLGNTAEASVTISNLDKEGPEVTLSVSPEVWKNGDAVITAHAQDAGCGLAEEAYAWEDGDFGTSTQLAVSKSGVYSVIVRDRNGNETKAAIEVTKIYQPAASGDGSGGSNGESTGGNHSGSTDSTNTGNGDGDTGNGSNDTKKDETLVDSEESILKKDPDDSADKTGKDKNEGSGQKKDDDKSDSSGKKLTAADQKNSVKLKTKVQVSSEEKTAKETESAESIADPENISDKTAVPNRESFFETGAGKAAAITVSSALLLIVISLLLYFLYMAARIYNRDTEGKYHYLGSLLIHHGEDQFCIAIPESMEEQSFTKDYEMRPGLFFLLLNHGDEMAIGRKDESPRVSMLIEKNMKFKL